MTGPVNLNTPFKTDFKGSAKAAWGNVPDWIEALADEATRTSGTAAAKRIGYSVGLVSAVLRNSYKGDMRTVEAKVRGALMGATVDCPVQGDMPRDVCMDWQGKPFAATSALRTQMFNACRTCPNSKKGNTHAE